MSNPGDEETEESTLSADPLEAEEEVHRADSSEDTEEAEEA